MLFKKFAVAAAVATTLAFVGCSKKEEAPATTEATQTEAVEATTEATETVEAAASDVAEAASDVAEAASDVAEAAASEEAPASEAAAQ